MTERKTAEWGRLPPMRISASRHIRARGVNACTGTCHTGPIRNFPVFNICDSPTKLDKHKKGQMREPGSLDPYVEALQEVVGGGIESLRTIHNGWRPGLSTLGTDMSTVVTDESADKTPSPEVSKRTEEVSERIEDAAVSDSSIPFELTDGRSVSVPRSWSWRREGATGEERQNVQISPRGYIPAPMGIVFVGRMWTRD